MDEAPWMDWMDLWVGWWNIVLRAEVLLDFSFSFFAFTWSGDLAMDSFIGGYVRMQITIEKHKR